MSKSGPSRCTGVVATACTQGKRTQHGKPQGAVKDDQRDAREGQARHPEVAERFVIPLWTALPLQVDLEKIRFGQLQTSIRRHPMVSGRPNGESARARLYSW